jgi:hypothetical protein
MEKQKYKFRKGLKNTASLRRGGEKINYELLSRLPIFLLFILLEDCLIIRVYEIPHDSANN